MKRIFCNNIYDINILSISIWLCNIICFGGGGKPCDSSKSFRVYFLSLLCNIVFLGITQANLRKNLLKCTGASLPRDDT